MDPNVLGIPGLNMMNAHSPSSSMSCTSPESAVEAVINGIESSMPMLMLDDSVMEDIEMEMADMEETATEGDDEDSDEEGEKDMFDTLRDQGLIDVEVETADELTADEDEVPPLYLGDAYGDAFEVDVEARPKRQRWGSIGSSSDSESSESEAEAPKSRRPRTRSGVSSCESEYIMSPNGASYSVKRRLSLGCSYHIFFDAGHQKKRVKAADEYEQSLQLVGTVKTVQEFWQFWNHIQFQKMPAHGDLSVFKGGIRPVWEHPENTNGGRWVVSGFPKEKSQEFFTNVVLALIGANFPSHENLCGVVLSMRVRGPSIAVWNKTVDPSLFQKVDVELRRLLGDSENGLQVMYKDHGGAIVNNCAKRGVFGRNMGDRLVPTGAPMMQAEVEAHKALSRGGMWFPPSARSA